MQSETTSGPLLSGPLPELPLVFSPLVLRAMRSARPLVALESTIMTHGLPAPHNSEIADQMEATIRDSGAEPATIAILQGQVKVGMMAGPLQHLVALECRTRIPARDLGAAVALKWSGGTTLSASLRICRQAGLKVFATGGIGGLHRGWQSSLMISADLQALAQTPVAVISAGPKPILDISATTRMLKMLGVPVIGWQTDVIPAFFTPHSDAPVSVRVDTVETLAEVVGWHFRANPGMGALIVAPLPADHAQQPAVIAEAIAQVEAEAAEGPAPEDGDTLNTALLQKMAALTQGKSIEANRALLLNNARLAAALAAALPQPPSDVMAKKSDGGWWGRRG